MRKKEGGREEKGTHESHLYYFACFHPFFRRIFNLFLMISLNLKSLSKGKD